MSELQLKKEAAINSLMKLYKAAGDASQAVYDLVNLLGSTGYDVNSFQNAAQAISAPSAGSGSTEPVKAKGKASARKPAATPAPSAASSADHSTSAPSAQVATAPTPVQPTPAAAATTTPATASSQSAAKQPKLNDQTSTPAKSVANDVSDAKGSGSPQKRKRASRDPNLPKRPLNAYLKFRNQEMKKLLQELQEKGEPEMSREKSTAYIRERWEALPTDVRVAIEAEHKQELLKYHEEVSSIKQAQEAGEITSSQPDNTSQDVSTQTQTEPRSQVEPQTQDEPAKKKKKTEKTGKKTEKADKNTEKAEKKRKPKGSEEVT